MAVEDGSLLKPQKLKNIGLMYRYYAAWVCIVLSMLNSLLGLNYLFDGHKPWRFFLISTIIFICFALSVRYKKYYKCPYCRLMVLVKLDWQCDHCLNYQGKEWMMYEPCIHCKQHLETAFCEHCHLEFKI